MQVLPSETQELLRTGVNLTSFESIIAELVENCKKGARHHLLLSKHVYLFILFVYVFLALDAGSTVVSVSMNTLSLSFEVRDNGNGISSVDMDVLFTRYATSKTISSRQYGFRGEALSSVANSSLKVELTSRAPESSRAFTKVVQDGMPQKAVPSECARAVGTTVIVTDVFHRFPVRKKSALGTPLVARVKSVLEVIAIARYDVALSLYDSVRGVQVFSTAKVNIAKQPTKQTNSHSLGVLFCIYKDAVTCQSVSRD